MFNNEYFGINTIIYSGNYQIIKKENVFSPIKFSSKRFDLNYYDTSEETIVINNDDDYETFSYPDKRFELSFYDLKLNDDFVSALTSIRIEYIDFEKFRFAAGKYLNWVKLAEENMISLRKHISNFDITSKIIFSDYQMKFYKANIAVSFFIESVFTNNNLSYYFVISLDDKNSDIIKGDQNVIEYLNIEKIYLSMSQVEEIYRLVEQNRFKLFEEKFENVDHLLDLFK